MHEQRLRFLSTMTALLALAGLLGALVGCGGEQPVATATPTRTPRPADPTEPPLPTATPTLIPTPIPTATPTPALNVNPLTGELVDDVSLLERPPVAIKISNWPPQYVRPQAGINSADIIYEHYNEGWNATRWTAIFLGEDPERVGPVRSGRLIDLELPAIYKAPLAAWGFSDGVAAIAREFDTYPNWIASYSLPEEVSPDPFYRDNSRDVPLEHTGYTDPAAVRAWAEAHGITGRQDLSGMVFSEEPPEGGTPATYIWVRWRGLDAEWRYDEASGRYLRWSDGTAHTDALTGEQLNVANVVILYVAQWDTDIVEEPHGGALSIRWALWDEGNPYRRALIFRDGQQFVGQWHREERWDMLTLTDEAGNPIPLKPGNTFFEVIPTEGLEVVVE